MPSFLDKIRDIVWKNEPPIAKSRRIISAMQGELELAYREGGGMPDKAMVYADTRIDDLLEERDVR